VAEPCSVSCSNPEQDSPVSLLLVGDTCCSCKTLASSPFANVEELLKKADIVFCNLETSVTTPQSPLAKKAVPLSIPEQNLNWLSEAGVHVTNCANNHIGDSGASGVNRMLHRLQELGIQTLGVGRDLDTAFREATFNISGIKIALMGFCEFAETEHIQPLHVALMNEQLVLHRISELRAVYDVIAVSLHWGFECVYYPSPEAQQFARQCIDAGARIVIGHHAHRFQGVEEYNNGLIIYSLGNFNFMPCGVGLSEWADKSAAVNVIFDPSRKPVQLQYEVLPISMDDQFRPAVLSDPNSTDGFRKHLETVSKRTSQGITRDFWMEQTATIHIRNNLDAFIKRIRKYGAGEIMALIKWCLAKQNREFIGFLIRSWLWRPFRRPV
jgi:hypothetical protein